MLSLPPDVENLLEARGSGVGGFFPGNREEFRAATNHGLLDALGMLGEIETEAAFDAEKIFVDAGEVAVVRAHNFVVANTESSFAAVRAVGANGGDVLHFPRARLVAIGAAGKRADRANVDAHAAFFAFEMIAAVGDDDALARRACRRRELSRPCLHRTRARSGSTECSAGRRSTPAPTIFLRAGEVFLR